MVQRHTTEVARWRRATLLLAIVFAASARPMRAGDPMDSRQMPLPLSRAPARLAATDDATSATRADDLSVFSPLNVPEALDPGARSTLSAVPATFLDLGKEASGEFDPRL